MTEIYESGMTFGPFEDKAVFLIEDSQVNEEAGERIRTVEFVLAKDTSKLYFIEAKSSAPNPVKNTERFEEFIIEITEKFLHSFNLFYATLFERYLPKHKIGDEIKRLNQSQTGIKFCLVINGFDVEWLAHILAALERKLYDHRAIWKSEVIVLNDKMAVDKKLIHNSSRSA